MYMQRGGKLGNIQLREVLSKSMDKSFEQTNNSGGI